MEATLVNGNTSIVLSIVWAETYKTFEIRFISKFNLCYLAEINMLVPHKPEGLIPYVIQSLFINCNISKAIFSILHF